MYTVFFIPILGNLNERNDEKMNYVIRNHKNVYIRLNSNGSPITCTEQQKTLFEYSKAKNVLTSLPKTLKRLKFKVEPVPDIIQKQRVDKQTERKIIQSLNYIVPDNISHWIEKFGICDDILKEAEERKDELNRELSNIDKQFINLIHEIEFEGKIDLYGGWQERNKIKENREKRRTIKDELLIISNVLRMDFRDLDREVINRAVVGLANRKYTYRIIEEENADAM